MSSIRGGNTSQLILWGHNYPEAKWQKTSQENYRLIFLMSAHAKIRLQYTSKLNLTTYRKDSIPWPSEFYARNIELFNSWKSCNIPY